MERQARFVDLIPASARCSKAGKIGRQAIGEVHDGVWAWAGELQRARQFNAWSESEVTPGGKGTAKSPRDAENIAGFSAAAQEGASVLHTTGEGYIDDKSRRRQGTGFTSGDGNAEDGGNFGQSCIDFFQILHTALRVCHQGNESMFRDAAHGCNVRESTRQGFASDKAWRRVCGKVDSFCHGIRLEQGVHVIVTPHDGTVVPGTEEEMVRRPRQVAKQSVKDLLFSELAQGCGSDFHGADGVMDSSRAAPTEMALKQKCARMGAARVRVFT